MALQMGRHGSSDTAIRMRTPRSIAMCGASTTCPARSATPRELFGELGGFDTRYGFGFYEDGDYCFAVRAAGRRVLYQPESIITHVEGSVGTDLTAGVKRFQVTNQRAFFDKWRRAPRAARSTRYDRYVRAVPSAGGARLLEGSYRMRALVCGYYPPEPDRDSGSRLASWITSTSCSTRGWGVDYVVERIPRAALCHHVAEARSRKLRRSRVLAQEIVAAGCFDLVIFAFWQPAERYLSMVRRVSPRSRIVVDSVDLQFLRDARRTQGLARALD